jgi:hypothetical protein
MSVSEKFMINQYEIFSSLIIDLVLGLEKV